MRRGLLIDVRGHVRVAAAPQPPAGGVYVGLSPSGAEVAFHGGRVPLPALAKALRLLLSCRPRRIALRLLPEAAAPVCIFSGVWEFARHAERLALPAAALVAEPAPEPPGKVSLVSRFSFL